MPADPLVSVVIPTHDRPLQVVEAVHSALSQSLDAIEVVVVIDGPDARTSDALSKIRDPRLVVRTLERNERVAAARNAGVAVARAPWVAFLDDDDLWLPNKLELQYEAARRAPQAHPIIAARVIARGQSTDYVWPRRFPATGEPIDEYLFCRRTPFFGEGLVPTNTLMTTRDLLLATPFDVGLRDHEDLDWLLRVCRMDGVAIEFVEEPLTIWHFRDGHSSMSSQTDWRYSLEWIRERKDLVTRHAYAGFLLTWLGATAARSGDRHAFTTILLEACRHGSARVMDLLTYAGYWFTPRQLQTGIAAIFGGRSRRTRPR